MHSCGVLMGGGGRGGRTWSRALHFAFLWLSGYFEFIKQPDPSILPSYQCIDSVSSRHSEKRGGGIRVFQKEWGASCISVCDWSLEAWAPSIFRLSEIAPGAFPDNILHVTVYCAHSYLGASLVPRQNGWLEITWPGDEATKGHAHRLFFRLFLV